MSKKKKLERRYGELVPVPVDRKPAKKTIFVSGKNLGPPVNRTIEVAVIDDPMTPEQKRREIRDVNHKTRTLAARPPQKYENGLLVSVPTGWTGFNTSNVEIVGSEWGENHRDFNRAVWIYYVKPRDSMASSKLVTEDNIGGRIT